MNVGTVGGRRGGIVGGGPRDLLWRASRPFAVTHGPSTVIVGAVGGRRRTGGEDVDVRLSSEKIDSCYGKYLRPHSYSGECSLTSSDRHGSTITASVLWIADTKPGARRTGDL